LDITACSAIFSSEFDIALAGEQLVSWWAMQKAIWHGGREWPWQKGFIQKAKTTKDSAYAMTL
jgi:hypothetical protein